MFEVIPLVKGWGEYCLHHGIGTESSKDCFVTNHFDKITDGSSGIRLYIPVWIYSLPLLSWSSSPLGLNGSDRRSWFPILLQKTTRLRFQRPRSFDPVWTELHVGNKTASTDLSGEVVKRNDPRKNWRFWALIFFSGSLLIIVDPWGSPIHLYNSSFFFFMIALFWHPKQESRWWRRVKANSTKRMEQGNIIHIYTYFIFHYIHYISIVHNIDL